MIVMWFCFHFLAPEIPRQVAAKFDKETECIHLLWYEPENDGGKPIEDYCVEYSKIDEEEWKKSEPVAETRWMVGNLEGGVKYRFRVCARNAVGSSSYREAENPVTFCCKYYLLSKKASFLSGLKTDYLFDFFIYDEVCPLPLKALIS